MWRLSVARPFGSGNCGSRLTRRTIHSSSSLQACLHDLNCPPQAVPRSDTGRGSVC